MFDTHRLPSFAGDTVHVPHHSLPGSSIPLRPPFSLFEISEEIFLEMSQCNDTLYYQQNAKQTLG